MHRRYLECRPARCMDPRGGSGERRFLTARARAGGADDAGNAAYARMDVCGGSCPLSRLVFFMGACYSSANPGVCAGLPSVIEPTQSPTGAATPCRLVQALHEREA